MKRQLLIILFGIILLSTLVSSVAPSDYKYYWNGSSTTDTISSLSLYNFNGVTVNGLFRFNNTNALNTSTISAINNVSEVKNWTISVWYNNTYGGSDTVWWFAPNSTSRFTATVIDGSLRVTWWRNSSAFSLQNMSWTGLRNNTWYNLIIGFNGTMYGFVNNGTRNSTTSAGTGSTGCTGTGIGGSCTATFTYNGTMNEFKIWDYALTTQQMSDVYALGNSPVTCVAPVVGTRLTVNTTLCGGPYTFNTNSKLFWINDTEGVTLDCNNTILINNISQTSGIGVAVRKSNNRVTNCVFINFSYSGVEADDYNTDATKVENVTIDHNIIVGSGGVAFIFTDGVTKGLNISYNYFYNGTDNNQADLAAHGIYVSADVGSNTYNGFIYNNYFYGMSASGIKLNGKGNISNYNVYNNYIIHSVVLNASRQSDICIVASASKNGSFYNNTCIDDGAGASLDTGILLGQGHTTTPLGDWEVSSGNRIYNNYFSGTVNAIWAQTNTVDNYIYNNTYSGSIDEEVRYGTKSGFKTPLNISIFVYENQTMYLGGWYGNYTFIKNWTGWGNFSIDNTTLNIYNAPAYFNDLKWQNNNTNISVNFVNTQTTLRTGTPYTVLWGNYTPDVFDSCTYSGSGDWNIYGLDNCTITTNTIVLGVLNIYGSSGVVHVNANITTQGFVKQNLITFATLNNNWVSKG